MRRREMSYDYKARVYQIGGQVGGAIVRIIAVT